MGIDRRSESNRRQYLDRRFGNSLYQYTGPEKRITFDRRNKNDRRQLIHQPIKIDLFKNANLK